MSDAETIEKAWLLIRGLEKENEELKKELARVKERLDPVWGNKEIDRLLDENAKLREEIKRERSWQLSPSNFNHMHELEAELKQVGKLLDWAVAGVSVGEPHFNTDAFLEGGKEGLDLPNVKRLMK